MISILSGGEYTFGPDGKYSTKDLDFLETSTRGIVSRINTANFKGDDLLVLQSYIILDVLSSTSGTGQVIEKTVKDSRWKVQPAKTSSYWMDKAYRMVADALVSSQNGFTCSKVTRLDAYLKNMALDNTKIQNYGVD
jgi:hypothetical protein